MRNVCRGFFLAGLVLGSAAIAPGSRLAAQEGKGEAVKITTVDGVDLHGLYFQSKAKEAPTIIVLHAIGDSAVHKKNYTALAESLQPSYSVMLFDFRGHGKSKEIAADLFWKVPQNAKMVKGFPKATTIDQKDFSKGYYPILCNDIAAVKAFLDRKNDSGACNTASTILIGAETGATLGAIWLNSEWQLYKMIPGPNPFTPPQPVKNPEGKDVIAALWLSISPKLGTADVPLSATLNTAARVNGTPMVFMYGDQDSKGKELAQALESKLKVKDDPRHQYIASYEVKGNTKLVGINLVLPSLGTEKAIAEYLEGVVDKKGGEWGKREFRTSQYAWRPGASGFLPAKELNGDPNNLMFNTYIDFMGSR
jgi:pimeloyl-ACP methyl ester carboxylesterase